MQTIFRERKLRAKILSVAAVLCLSFFSAGARSATEMPNMLTFSEKYGLGDQAMSLCAIRGGEACMTSGSTKLFYLRVGQIVDSDVYQLSMENGDSASRLANSPRVKGLIDRRIQEHRKALYYLIESSNAFYVSHKPNPIEVGETMEFGQDAHVLSTPDTTLRKAGIKAVPLNGIRLSTDKHMGTLLASFLESYSGDFKTRQYYRKTGQDEFFRTVAPVLVEIDLVLLSKEAVPFMSIGEKGTKPLGQVEPIHWAAGAEQLMKDNGASSSAGADNTVGQTLGRALGGKGAGFSISVGDLLKSVGGAIKGAAGGGE